MIISPVVYKRLPLWPLKKNIWLIDVMSASQSISRCAYSRADGYLTCTLETWERKISLDVKNGSQVRASQPEAVKSALWPSTINYLPCPRALLQRYVDLYLASSKSNFKLLMRFVVLCKPLQHNLSLVRGCLCWVVKEWALSVLHKIYDSL